MMFAWGSTIHGKLGLRGKDENILVPQKLEWIGANMVVQVACGDKHSLFLTKDGRVYSCGSDNYEQLGVNEIRKRPQPSLIKLVTGLNPYHITHIACGYSHCMALNQKGQVFTWGSDACGQLGHQLGQTIQATPKCLRALATIRVVQIACGQNHSIALTITGEIYVWGANSHGQLGVGTTTPYEDIPLVVSSLYGIPIAFIGCGGYHTFAVSRSGAVFGWGKNSYGQLGLNDTQSRHFPNELTSLKNARVRYVSCGLEFSTFLTLDGNVFTCGAGMYGQLGHGNAFNEILPKKVLELTESTVTQVSCGHSHTLVLVPSRECVYSFGLGAAGQLGIKNPSNTTTPQVVHGLCVSQRGFEVVPGLESLQPNCIVNRIFAGGDHCFATIMERSKHIPFDCREFVPETQILSLNYDRLTTCSNIRYYEGMDQELNVYIKNVFKSQACINASFLLPNEGHYCCTSKHHGVDLKLTEDAFTLIEKFKNQAIKDVIWNYITEGLLKNLSASPPNVEALRIFLTLPFYHEFNNPEKHRQLHKPFCGALLALQSTASEAVSELLSLTSSDYFKRLIIIFKNVAIYIIRKQTLPRNFGLEYDVSLYNVLEMLKFLHKLNLKPELGLKVAHDTFYLPELWKSMNVSFDYLTWLCSSESDGNLLLCNYSFLLDARTKIEQLKVGNPLPTEILNVGGYRDLRLVLNVTRESIVEDTHRELFKVDSADLKKSLKVRFYGEEAEDEGGVQKEFFMLILKAILNPKYGMFKEYEETRTIWFSSESSRDKNMFLLIGLICGLAIYNFAIIDLPFPLALYKKLLKEPITLADLKDLSPTLANSLKSILDYTEPDFEKVFSINFEVTSDVKKVIPLKKNGEKIPVTQENKQEYVDLYVDFIFNRSIKELYEAFATGFTKVCSGRALELFNSHELMSTVVGNENYDWHTFEKVAVYKKGYKSSDCTIRWFWEVFHELPLSDKKKFLFFLTGCDKVPIEGMKAIQITIRATDNDAYLPVAHTCFNCLELPKYKTKEKLRNKLILAIQQTQGFHLI